MTGGAAPWLHSMRPQPLPSIGSQELDELLAVARWLAATPADWRPPQQFQALSERLADAFQGRHGVVLARVHDCILPPPAVALLAGTLASVREQGLSEVGDRLAAQCADGLGELRLDRPMQWRDELFAHVLPILPDGRLWGVIGLTAEDGAPPLAPLAIEVLRVIAAQIAARLEHRRPAPERRQSSDERLMQAAIESIDDGIIVYDAEYRVAAYNSAWREHTRMIRPGEDLRGVALTELYQEHVRHGSWTVEQADLILRDILTGRSFGIPDRRIETDGRHVRIRNFQIPEGGIVAVRSDVTETVERERALLRAREEAEAASRAKSTFLASVSHELRTPLNAIIGFSDVMAQEVFGPLGVTRYREYVGDIHRSGTLLLSLINDIMDMARVESGKVELSPESFALDTVIEEVLRLVRLRADAKSIRLELDLSPNLPAAFGDRRATTQILLNIVVNAVKFTPPAGRVAIRAVPYGRMVEVSVSDTGPGIRGDDLARLGRPFERVQVSAFDAQPENKGTGLGLAISRTLAELQKGSLRLESEVGVGTVVRLRLPREPEQD